MQVVTGKIGTGPVVQDEEGFHLDEQSQQELLEAMREIERGEFVTKEQLFSELKQLK